MNQIEYVEFPDGIQVSMENPGTSTHMVSKDLYEDENQAREAFKNGRVEWSNLITTLIRT